jgi:hypothetical protein
MRGLWNFVDEVLARTAYRRPVMAEALHGDPYHLLRRRLTQGLHYRATFVFGDQIIDAF